MGMGTPQRKISGMSKAPKATSRHKSWWFLFCQIIQINGRNALTYVDFMAGRRNHTPKVWLGIVAFRQGKKELHEAKAKRGIGFGAGSVDLSLEWGRGGSGEGLCSLCCSWLRLQLWQGWAERGGQTAGRGGAAPGARPVGADFSGKI